MKAKFDRALWLKNNADRVRAYKREHARRAYRANPKKFLNRAKEWRAMNLEAARKRDKFYAGKYADKRKKWFDSWRRRHREYFRTHNRKQVKELADWYVRQKLSQGTNIKPSAWPDALVECKRAQMKARKLCRDLKTSTN